MQPYLQPAEGAEGTLLATFKHKRLSSSRGSITIYPIAVSTGSTSPIVLLCDGKPSWLLDVALVAEMVYKQDLERQTRAAAGSSGW